jgi:hypothetical protein
MLSSSAYRVLVGYYDDESVIYLIQRLVNVVQSGWRVVSHLREDCETLTSQRRRSGRCSRSLVTDQADDQAIGMEIAPIRFPVACHVVWRHL